MNLKQQIIEAIKDILAEMNIASVFVLEDKDPSDGHGDFATNVALVAAKQLKTNPKELAEQFKSKLRETLPTLENIEVAGPGFINFYLPKEIFRDVLCAIASAKKWTNGESCAGEEVLFEYTSPNLFKPLHVGNLVGNIIGESVSRLLESEGAIVHRLNYPSDIGLTVAKGVWGLRETKGDPDNIADLGEAYRYGSEQYENNPAAKLAIDSVNKALYAGDNEALNELRRRGIETSRARLNELCAILGTRFDMDIPESVAAPLGKKIVEEHIGDVFTESEGAVIFSEENSGLHTRVFLNSAQLPTYEAKEIGNFVAKQKSFPDWTQFMVVTGGEQTEYFKVVFEAIRHIFPESTEKHLEHIPTGFLTLTTGKMSSRKGNILSGEALIEEVRLAALDRAKSSRAENVDDLATQIAVAALKFQILRQKVGSNIVFDKAQALSFEGDSGPYLQYTYARLCSLLEKGDEMGITPILSDALDMYEIERLPYRFAEIVKESTNERAPHKLVKYLLDLTSCFNAFYAKEIVLDQTNPKKTAHNLLIVLVTQKILERGLFLLGIPAPKKM
jgi:arginyl-tRNA synthetase